MTDPFSDPFTSRDFWKLDPPCPIYPAPVATAESIRGRRVLIGLPGLGWQGDLRADERIVQGSRTYVPVMPEAEWYRAESEQTEVFAALVPSNQVWVEELGVPRPLDHSTEPCPQLISLDEPPKRYPCAAEQAGFITGRRAVRLLEDGGEQRDLRVTTELYAGNDGTVCARVCIEVEWYRWSRSGKFPQTLEVPASLLWIE